MINEKIDSILEEIQNAKAKTEKEIDELRVHLLGKKGEITQLFDEFRTISADKKREFGQKLNNLKNLAAAKIEELRSNAGEPEGAAPSSDMTMPGDHFELGTRHPISITREEIISIFRKQGYALAEGPEIEDDHHVFETHSSSPRASIPSCSVPTPAQYKSGRWRPASPPSGSSAPAECSGTRPSLPVPTASSTR